MGWKGGILEFHERVLGELGSKTTQRRLQKRHIPYHADHKWRVLGEQSMQAFCARLFNRMPGLTSARNRED